MGLDARKAHDATVGGNVQRIGHDPVSASAIDQSENADNVFLGFCDNPLDRIAITRRCVISSSV
jgi:hypothetical protein